MKININEKDRVEIIKKIINSNFFLGDYKQQEGGIITFLEMIWDLRSMKSNDNRFTNARDDIWKHIVMNDDMTIEELFLDRLSSSYKDDDIFIKFVNTVVHPSVIPDNTEREDFVSFLNSLFSQHRYKFIIQDYFGDIPIFNLSDKISSIGMPQGIEPNKIAFYKEDSALTIKYPCFKLILDNWNDWFKWKTQFLLRYYKSKTEYDDIGFLKIMKENEDITNKALPDYFKSLNDDFCSIGQNEEYYENMKKYSPQNCHSIFLALNDAAMYPTIRTKFSKNQTFINSLLRESTAKQMIDSARFVVNNIDIRSYYKFSYSFTPPYTNLTDEENIIIVDFDFIYNTDFNQRIYGLIGKNGTGKTTFLSNMATDFAKANPLTIIPQKPLYNKVITISFSFFDKLPLPEVNAEFNYTYLGLRNTKEKDINKALQFNLISSLKLINEEEKVHFWNSIIKKIFHKNVYKEFVDGSGVEMEINVDEILEKYDRLSSGENLLMYIISSLVAEIENNTLILFDEPETHLHPNAISALMNALHILTEDFNSFCIIATHSPLVIQEITSKNVKVFNRIGDKLEINSIGYETFAENLTTITDEIFGNREVAKYHYDILQKITKSKKMRSYGEIIEIVKNDKIPVPLNIQLYIKEILSRNEKS